MMEYRVVTGYPAAVLTTRVACCLMVGWEPLGGVAVDSQPDGDSCYLQATVRRQVSKEQ